MDPTRAIRLVCVAVLIWHGAEFAEAQTVVSERDVLQSLGPSHPAIRALEERAAEARGERAAASKWDNPTIWLERESFSDDINEIKYGVTLTLPFDGRRSARHRAARHGLAAAEAEIGYATMQLRQTAREDYAAWYVANERRDSYRQIHELADRLSKMMQERASTGEASRLASSRLTAAAGELRTQYQLAEADVVRSTAALARWHTFAESGAIPTLPELPPPPSDADILARPDIVAAHNRVSQSEALKTLSGRWWEFPSIDLGHIDPSTSAGGFYFGASMALPLFSRNPAERARAQSQVSAAHAAYDRDTLHARLEWESALDAYQKLREAALGLSDAADVSAHIVTAAQAAFEAGEMGITDLLETLRSVQSSRDSALELFASALAAHRRLELAAGTPLLNY